MIGPRLYKSSRFKKPTVGKKKRVIELHGWEKWKWASFFFFFPQRKKDFILSMNFFQKNHQSRSPCKFLIFHAENPCTSYVTFALCWWCCTTVQKQHELRITWMGQLMCCAMMMSNFIGIGMMMAKQKNHALSLIFWGIKNAIKEVSDGHFRLSNGRDFLSSPFYHPFHFIFNQFAI